MAKAGRKRKQGRRTESGRLSRAAQPVRYDRGTQRTADKFSVYGQDGSDAIGRAYIAGLLGEDGLNLRNAARAIFRAYWPAFSVGRLQCAIGDKTWGAVNDDTDHERERKREEWLGDKIALINRMGRDTRRAFDQLCININPDHGPDWLDRLIAARVGREQILEADVIQLERALNALREIAS